MNETLIAIPSPSWPGRRCDGRSKSSHFGSGTEEHIKYDGASLLALRHLPGDRHMRYELHPAQASSIQ